MGGLGEGETKGFLGFACWQVSATETADRLHVQWENLSQKTKEQNSKQTKSQLAPGSMKDLVSKNNPTSTFSLHMHAHTNTTDIHTQMSCSSTNVFYVCIISAFPLRYGSILGKPTKEKPKNWGFAGIPGASSSHRLILSAAKLGLELLLKPFLVCIVIKNKKDI